MLLGYQIWEEISHKLPHFQNCSIRSWIFPNKGLANPQANAYSSAIEEALGDSPRSRSSDNNRNADDRPNDGQVAKLPCCQATSAPQGANCNCIYQAVDAVQSPDDNGDDPKAQKPQKHPTTKAPLCTQTSSANSGASIKGIPIRVGPLKCFLCEILTGLRKFY